MYLLRKGAVVVLKDDRVSHTLTRGAFFGEITLLFPTVRRTASVRAVTECEMSSLTKEDLETVASHYPDFLEMMATVAKSHLKKDATSPSRQAKKKKGMCLGHSVGAWVSPSHRSSRRCSGRRGSFAKDGTDPTWLSQYVGCSSCSKHVVLFSRQCVFGCVAATLLLLPGCALSPTTSMWSRWLNRPPQPVAAAPRQSVSP